MSDPLYMATLLSVVEEVLFARWAMQHIQDRRQGYQPDSPLLEAATNPDLAIWTTRDDRQMLVCSMTSQHLRNAHRYIRRRASEREKQNAQAIRESPLPAQIEGMLREFESSAGHPHPHHDRYMEVIDTIRNPKWFDFLHPMFWAMDEEMRRRNLAPLPHDQDDSVFHHGIDAMSNVFKGD